ncbi:hypothetical protein BCR39DRAFT_558921 [Naematelia encephala]|uniref:SET domain-containing protein n=1 Tax=Naematelia encephala TaxID=71784 RepID=A0A1Y2B4P7_9TREE|nr:hypothetical protein BCR39DRAFT_558921 [Naematelia encephala]
MSSSPLPGEGNDVSIPVAGGQSEPIDLCSDTEAVPTDTDSHLSLAGLMGMAKKQLVSKAKEGAGPSFPQGISTPRPGKASGSRRTSYGDTVKKRQPSSSGVRKLVNSSAAPIDVSGDTTDEDVVIVPTARRKSSASSRKSPIKQPSPVAALSNLPSPPLTTQAHVFPPPQLGSWENPQPIEYQIKRRPSPTLATPEDDEDPPRSRKNRRIEPYVQLQPEQSRPKRLGPLWATESQAGPSGITTVDELGPSVETNISAGDAAETSGASVANSRRPSSAASTEDPLLLHSGASNGEDYEDEDAKQVPADLSLSRKEEEDEEGEVSHLFNDPLQDADDEMEAYGTHHISTLAPLRILPLGEGSVGVNEVLEDVRTGVDEVTISSMEPSQAGKGAPSAKTDDVAPLVRGPLEYKPYVTGKAISFLRERREKRAASSQPSPSPIVVDTPTPPIHIVTDTPTPPIHVIRDTPTPPPAASRELMTRAEWRKVVELDGESGDVDVLLQSEHGSTSSGPSSAIETIDYSVSTVVRSGVLAHPPDDRRGQARRQFDPELVDSWNARWPKLANNPTIHRLIFQGFITESLLRDGEFEDEIRVVNGLDGRPPAFEFQYANRMLYHPDTPDPELGLGCDCEGPCDPNSKTCSCVKRQKLYFYDTGLNGFAYHRDGTIKETSVSVWECGKNCKCSSDCMNRVIQRGRNRRTKIELFKTRMKGWGIRSAAAVKIGTFIGVYSGELITDAECERRGRLYTEIGRTYLFDCDGWQIANPPVGLEKVDPRLAQTARESSARARHSAREESEDYKYSAFSIDAFHYGNYTRYFNHSCNPNLAITQAYVYDFHPERPMLVIFACKNIEAGEELCISYKGIPDEDEGEPVRKAPVKRGKRRKGRQSKTSASVHIAADKRVQVKASRDQCFCGAPNCDGRMFGLSLSDEED